MSILFALLTLLLVVTCCSDSPVSPSPITLLEKALTTPLSAAEKSQVAMMTSEDVKVLFTSRSVIFPAFPYLMRNMVFEGQERLKRIIISLAMKPSFVDDADWPTGTYQNEYFLCSLLIPGRPMVEVDFQTLDHEWLPTMTSIVYLHLTPTADVDLSMLSGYVTHRDCHVNDLLKLCLWLKHLKIDAEKIRQWIDAFEPAIKTLISVFALDDWNSVSGSFTSSMKAFQCKKGYLSSNSNAITTFRWLYENRDKSSEVVSFVKSLHDDVHAWLELITEAKPVHRPIIDWVWQVMSEIPGFKISTKMDFYIDSNQYQIKITINVLRAVGHNKQLAYSLFENENHDKVAILLLLICEGPFEPILADIFADGLAKHFQSDFHAFLWGEFSRHFLLEKEPVKNGSPFGMPIDSNGSLRPDLYLAGLSQTKNEIK